jgi:glyoxylase-like metal-dependent hydrolase (beta-lactamase superfamily II)
MGGDFSKMLDAICAIWYIKIGEEYILIDTSFKLDDMVKLGIGDLCKRQKEEQPENCFRINNINAEKVTKVIITHAHTDHIGNLEMFGNAEFFIHKNEMDYAVNPPKWHLGYNSMTSNHLNSIKRRLTIIDSYKYDIDEGIKVELIGGHSPGSLAVYVDNGNDIICFAGDNIPFYKNIENDTPTAFYHNLDQVLEFMKKMKISKYIVIPGHDEKIYKKYKNGIIK